MEIVLTAGALLLILAALTRGLQHPFYALHIILTAGTSWLIETYWLGPVEIFSERAIGIAIAVHLVMINVTTWLAYYYDKRASQRGQWRIPERTLHAFMFIGGTPAAWLAQKTLRHKNRKRSFQAMFWLIFLLQVFAIAALLFHLR